MKGDRIGDKNLIIPLESMGMLVGSVRVTKSRHIEKEFHRRRLSVWKHFFTAFLGINLKIDFYFIALDALEHKPQYVANCFKVHRKSFYFPLRPQTNCFFRETTRHCQMTNFWIGTTSKNHNKLSQ